ncbi:type II secretion system protein [Methylotenera sp.]|jgi:prepilin-type N-terminal cleavage/methylation domain-containing protein|uniref:type II secretion system protein n=1 Tax=Methylotenera sp. TaxID=2051956 RepID=UPI00273361EA|nr:type II secretion system protein [Methylotenera sp.]MDP3212034.1 type II secretion system protein [Methylotenera sp.]
MMKAKQQGFTLLELLVVITLLAVLSVGALVAYEGIGENASNVSAANSIKTADSAIRAFRAVENRYPNQWDNLANLGGEVGNAAGGAFSVLAPATRAFFGQAVGLTSANAPVQAAMMSLARVGVTEYQTLTTAATLPAGLAPNEFFNESSGATVPADEIEVELNANGTFNNINEPTFAMSIVPSGGAAGTCTFDGINLAQNFLAQTEPVVAALNGASAKLNRINDALDADVCHLVVALGFGKDVPGTTLGSRVAISTAPTYTNGTVINPANNYARYIALFHLGSDDEDNANDAVDQDELFDRARLLAVVDTEGRNIDTAIAGAFAN